MATFATRVQFLDDTDPFSSTNFPEPSRPPTHTFLTNVHLINQLSGLHRLLRAPHKLEDCALQLYKYNSNGQADFGVYLDLESTLDDQWEDLEGFHEQRKNTIILRTQLSVRVHAIIEKLLNSEGRELRRALFSLKQIFQDDKDLVHEFVNSDGLDCLIKVGSEADQNHQNYILRALGQVMLYVDGMNGVISHNETIQWLYALTASKFRLVAKTALKLLLVFVEYNEANTTLLTAAVYEVDRDRRVTPFQNLMEILDEKDGGDSELCMFAMTLINKALAAVPDQDTFFDITDYLEEQGMELIIKKQMSRAGTDLDLISQFNIYEAALKAEDGDDELPSTSTQDLRQQPRVKSESEVRKSRRSVNSTASPRLPRQQQTTEEERPKHLPISKSVFEQQQQYPQEQQSNGDAGMSYLEKRRAERAARKEREMAEAEAAERQQQKKPSTSRRQAIKNDNGEVENVATAHRTALCEERGPKVNGAETQERTKRDSGYGSWGNEKTREKEEVTSPTTAMSNNRRWMLYKMNKKSQDDLLEPVSSLKEQPTVNQTLSSRIDNLRQSDDPISSAVPVSSGETNVASLTDKLRDSKIGGAAPLGSGGHLGAASGSIAAMKDKLAQSGGVPTTAPGARDLGKSSASPGQSADVDSRWEGIERSARRRALVIKDLDFTDLSDSEEIDILQAPMTQFVSGQLPPPPGGIPPPPGGVPLPPPFGVPAPPSFSGAPPGPPGAPPVPMMNGGLKKTDSNKKKTVKLHWKEVKDSVHIPNPTPKAKKQGTIWQKITPTQLDINKFEHLFETRTADAKAKKQMEAGKKLITVLGSKRSNAINIGLTKLPPARTIKAAILKMDSSIINREGIEKILSTMIPSAEEKQKIMDAQVASPDLPLGSAEQLLLTMSSITELEARLHLWAFKLDYDQNEKEIAEPLSDLKDGISALYISKTFKYILSTLLAIGNFLNGANCSGFHIGYLAKVPEVKDTVHKHSLLHHLCVTVHETYPDTTDLYCEVSPIARCSRVDWDELKEKLSKLENDCKKAMDNLRLVAKHENYSTQNLRGKLSDFLSDCAERIVVLRIVHTRMINRYYKMLLFLGITAADCKELKVHYFCKVVSEFALEYRTTREKVLLQQSKKKSYKERKKTRGKLIVDTNNFGRNANEIKQEEAQLTDILTNGYNSDTTGGRKKRPSMNNQITVLKKSGTNTEAEDTGDELLESAFRSAAMTAPVRQRTERKRSQYRHRKSLRRTLKGGIIDEEGNKLQDVLKLRTSSAAC